MASECSPSFTRILVTHLIDPSTFWFVNDEDYTNQKVIESGLAEVMKLHAPSFSRYAKISVPMPGQLVAVKGQEYGQWHRAEVQAYYVDTCLVFLLDHGLAKQVPTRNVHPMPPGNLAMEIPNASWIQLRHITPVKTLVFAERPPQVTEANVWDPAAYKFIADKLASAEAAYIVTNSEFFEIIEGGLFGQLLLKVDGQLADVGDLLIANKYAKKSDHFNKTTCLYKLDPKYLRLGPNVTDTQHVCSPMQTDIHNRDKRGAGSDRHTEEGGGDAPQAKPREETSYTFCPAGATLTDFLKPIPRNRARLAFMSDCKPPWRLPVRSPSTGGDMSAKEVTTAGLDHAESAAETQASPGSADHSRPQMLAIKMMEVLRSPGCKGSPNYKARMDAHVASVADSTIPGTVSPGLLITSPVGSSPSSIPSASPIAQSPQVVSSPPSVVSPRPDVAPADMEVSLLDKKSLLFKKLFNLETPVEETVQEMESASGSGSPIVSPPILSPPPNNVSPPPNDLNSMPSAFTKRSLKLKQLFSVKSPECESVKQESASVVASPSQDLSGNVPVSVAGVAGSGSAAAVPNQGGPGHMPSERSLLSQPHPRVAKPVTVGIMDVIDKTRVLVHGKPVDKLNNLASADLPPVIHKGLSRMNVTALKQLQSYAWPAILRGDSVVMVHQKAGGKTLGFLVPVLSRLMNKANYKQFVKKSNGPFALVLCSGARSCEMVYNACISLLAGSRSIKVLLTHGGGAELEKKSALTNGCDLLISTPRCFLRLLAYSKYLVNLHRLCHLVVDEADVMLDKFLPELRTVLASCHSATLHRLQQGVAVNNRLQLVVAAKHWSTQLYAAVHAITPDPLVLIGSYLEAAIYAHIRPKLEIMEKSKKLDTVLGILSGTKGLYKTVIVCQDKSEAVPLFSYLAAQLPDVQFLLIHEDILGAEIQDVRCQWLAGADGDYPVLVCTDAAVLQDMTISDARLLVHYNLPSKRTPFGARFTLLMDSYPDIHLEAGAQPDCMVHILADEGNPTQLPGIVNLMSRLGATILPIVETITEEMRLARECAKTNLPLCYNLKAFGECWEAKECVDRHVVIEADRPVNIPTHGRVKLKVVSVLDTCCFSARLLELTLPDGTTEQVKDDYVSLALEMALWFSSSSADEEPRVHGTTRVGDVCALEVTPGLFERAKVTQVTLRDKYDQPAEVTVVMLDSGVVKLRVRPLRLLALPERLQDVAPQVVTVFLCRLVPGDNDLNYSTVSYQKMCRWISDADAQEAEGTFLVGDIRLSLDRTLWLDPLHIKRSLRSVDAEVVGVALRRQLIRDLVAVDNPGHLDPLYAMCRAAGITDFPEPAAAEAQEPTPANGAAPLPTPCWAHLPAAAPRPPLVMVSADSPAVVFVRRHDLQPSLTRLTRDMQAHVAGRGKKATSYGGAGLVIAAGALCLGRSDQDGLWHRAKVTGVTGEGGVELFFVDYGDRRTVDAATEVTPIEERFVTVLPFQAIECSLFGLAPLEVDLVGWSTTAVDLIYDLTVWEADGTARLLEYEIYVTDAEATSTGGRRYAVALIDPCAGDGRDSVINRVLLEEGLAQAMEDEMSFLGDLPRSAPPRAAEELPPDVDMDVDVADARGKEEFVRLADLKGKRAAAVNETDDLKMADGETCFDFEIDDVQRFIFDMVNGRSAQAAQQLAAINSLPAPPQRPALCAAPAFKESSPPKQAKMVASVDGQPSVVWYQTMDEVHLSVEVVDVVTYQLQTDVMGLTLAADTADSQPRRHLHMDLFGAVDPRRTDHFSTGRRIKVKMIKLYTGAWPHLLQNPDKCYYWLRYDIEHTVDTDGGRLGGGSLAEEVDSDLVEERARAALATAAATAATHPIYNKDDILPDFQYNDSSSESENSDFAEDDKPFEFNDFHDPLA